VLEEMIVLITAWCKSLRRFTDHTEMVGWLGHRNISVFL